MTKQQAPVFAPYLKRTAQALGPRTSRWLLAGSVLALAACSSTPLPEWKPRSTPASTPAASTAPTATSVGEPEVHVAPVASNLHVQALPYSADIAAFFPDPAERYGTPGLSEGRTSFTSNEELAELLRELAAASTGTSTRLGVINTGNAQSGAPIHALIATRAAALSPQALEDTGRPTVMVVAGQQGNEPAATEAVLTLAKELGDGGLLEPLLQQINIILVPRANPDGFAQGIPTTANGTDLRHDHLALQTPEARFLARLVRDYQPSMLLDASEFAAIEPTRQRFDAVRANDMGLQYAAAANSHEFVTKAAREWLHQPAMQALQQAGQRVDWAFAPSGNRAEDGFAMLTAAPTSLGNVSSLKNIPSLQLQSRGSDLGYTHIQRRMHGHVQGLMAALQSAARHAPNLSKVEGFVQRDIASQACKGKLVVDAVPAAEQRDITLIDIYTAQLRQQPAAWSNSLRLVQPHVRSQACGYWLSADALPAAERLGMLGVNVQRVAELSDIDVQTYQNQDETNGHFTLQQGSLQAPPGSYYVSMNQPLAYVAAAALEPDTPYSFYRTGIVRQLQDVARVVSLPQIVFEEE